MPEKDVPWLLLERHFSGACTPEEQATLDSWLAGDPTRQLFVERMRTLFSETPPTPVQADIEREWNKLATKITPRPKRTVPLAALLAAGVLALLGAAWLVARHASHS
jgi:ferric-dicitrate binding protein FerR (iron transport regulator)